MRLFNHRPHLYGWVEWVTGLKCLGPIAEFGKQRFLDGSIDDQAGTRVAGLALVVPDTIGDRHGDGVQIFHIASDDVGALATALQTDALHIGVRGILKKGFTDLSGAGKSDSIDAVMQAQCLARYVAKACDYLEGASGDTSALGKLGHFERCQARLLSGLEYHRVASAQCRADLPAGDNQRVVPGHHGGDHAHRLTVNHADAACPVRCRLAVKLVE